MLFRTTLSKLKIFSDDFISTASNSEKQKDLPSIFNTNARDIYFDFCDNCQASEYLNTIFRKLVCLFIIKLNLRIGLKPYMRDANAKIDRMEIYRPTIGIYTRHITTNDIGKLLID